MRTRNHDYLFSNVDWFSVDQHQRKALQNDVSAIDADRLLNSSTQDLAKFLEEKYQINVPSLNREEITVGQRESQIDVSRDQMRYISDRSRPFLIKGTAIDVCVPFDGDSEAFKVRPTTYDSMPPRARVSEGQLTFTIEGPELNADAVRNEIERTLQSISKYLEWLRGNAKGLNDQLPGIAHSAIEQRKQKLLADRNLVSGLGFKMKERPGQAKTYVAPEVRRRINPKTIPLGASTPFKPEPILDDADYDHILGVISQMAHVMERSPSAFRTMDEEALRTHFLVQLNGHYEGQATGETFNYQGKTDILIRSGGKNIFIAECKFWSGPKKLLETIDQLLSYSAWRDTKVAVVVFNRNKDFSNVINTIRSTTETHTHCKRFVTAQSETSFRFVFGQKDDPNREIVLTVMAFDVPS